jgi:WD40 repeat protein
MIPSGNRFPDASGTRFHAGKSSLCVAALLTIALLGSGVLYHSRSEEPRTTARSPDRLVDREGDPLPPGVMLRLGSVRWRDPRSLATAALSVDGKYFATFGDTDGDSHAFNLRDCVIKVWEQGSGKEVRLLVVPNITFRSMVFSPDGKLLACAGLGGLQLLNSATATVVRHWEDGYGFLKFSPDGKYLVTHEVRNLRVLDVRTGQHRDFHGGHDRGVTAIDVSTNGKMVASGGGDDFVKIWDYRSGRELASFRSANVRSVAFMGNDKVIAASGFGEMISLWDVETKRHLMDLKGCAKGNLALASSADGATISAGGMDGTVRCWDVTTGERVATFFGNRAAVILVAFLPQGRVLCAASEDGTMRVWDYSSGKELSKLPRHDDRITAITFSSDGRKIASGSEDHSIRIWSAETGDPLAEVRDLRGIPRVLVFQSRDTECVSATSVPGPLHEITLHRMKQDNFGPPQQLHEKCRLASFSTGRPVAATVEGSPSVLRVWSRSSRSCSVEIPLSVGSPVLALGLSPAAAWVAALRADGSVAGYDTRTGEPLFANVGKGSTGDSACLCFSAEGKLVVWDGRETVTVLTVPSGRKRKEISFPAKRATAAAFSLDGRLLALTFPDKRIRLLDLVSGRAFQEFTAPYPLSSLAVSPANRLLAGGGEGNYAILVWDLTGGIRPNSDLRQTAEDPLRLRSLWRDLGSSEPAQAIRAIWGLVVARTASVPFIASELRDLDRDDPRRMGLLCIQLDAADFSIREAADHELRRFLSEEAERTLEQTLRSTDSAEVRKRLATILEQLPLTRLQVTRAIQVLEAIGDQRAEELLRSLATQSGARWSREEAADSLDRVRSRTGQSPPQREERRDR